MFSCKYPSDLAFECHPSREREHVGYHIELAKMMSVPERGADQVLIAPQTMQGSGPRRR